MVRISSRRRRLSALVGSVAAVLVFAACGNGGTSSDDGDGGDGGTGAEVDLSAAQDVVDAALEVPSSIGYDTPLSQPAPTGKKIVALINPVGINEMKAKAQEAAATALGWSYKRIAVGSGPEDPAKAFGEALDDGADGVFYAGYNTQAIQVQLDRAAEEGVTVIGETIPDEDNPNGLTMHIRNLDHVRAQATKLAAWVAIDSGGEAKVALFNLPTFPALSLWSETFTSKLKEFCSSCTVDTTNQQITDIGTAGPGQVVSALQRDPDLNYLAFTIADQAKGVYAALSSAGLSEQAAIVANIPGLEAIEALKNGEPGAYTADITPVVAWRQMDGFARSFIGDDTSIVETSPYPVQILTPDNINDVTLDEDGYYVGLADYQDEYKKLWLLDQ